MDSAVIRRKPLNRRLHTNLREQLARTDDRTRRKDIKAAIYRVVERAVLS